MPSYKFYKDHEQIAEFSTNIFNKLMKMLNDNKFPKYGHIKFKCYENDDLSYHIGINVYAYNSYEFGPDLFSNVIRIRINKNKLDNYICNKNFEFVVNTRQLNDIYKKYCKYDRYIGKYNGAKIYLKKNEKQIDKIDISYDMLKDDVNINMDKFGEEEYFKSRYGKNKYNIKSEQDLVAEQIFRIYRKNYINEHKIPTDQFFSINDTDKYYTIAINRIKNNSLKN